MKYEDLDKTQDLFDIPENFVPSPIENIEMEGVTKKDLGSDIQVNEEKLEEKPQENENKKDKKAKKDKKSLKEKWANLPKKKKIIIIISVILLLLLIIVLLVLLFTKKEEKPVKKEKEPVVILEKENYIYKDGILTFIDDSNNEIGTYKCENKDEKLCYVSFYSDEDNFDTSKNVYEDNNVIKNRSNIYDNKYVFVYDNKNEEDEEIKLYNIKDEKVENSFNLVKGFNDSNFIILKDKNNMYGAVEITDTGINEKFEFNYEYLGRLDKDSKVVAKKNNRYFIYSLDSKLESKGISSEIKSYNDKYLVTNSSGYTITDYDGREILEDSFDYISLLEGYILAVDKNKIYIRDYQNNKYNEDGITLHNDNYNIINIYDKDKKLVESKKSFEASVSGNSIELITYKDGSENSTIIDTNEGILSNKLKYLNYFGGKLYFYSDEEKTDLIGVYSCNNKNSVGASTKNLSNCFVAKDSFFSKNNLEIDNSKNIGTIPVFNESFVFITDTIDKKKSNVVLYDLKNSRVLSKYESVDTGSYTKSEDITFKNTDNTLILAKNTSGKYGMIKISSREVKSAITFKYDSLENFRDYYLASSTTARDTRYWLLDETGKEITKDCEYKIVDYHGNYLVTVNNNKYYVYDFLGNRIDDSTGYNHIVLYDDYYAVINANNKLDIHEYSRPFKLESPIDIGTSNYNNAFTIEKKSTGGYRIKISKNNAIYEIDAEGKIEE